jgi:hypothetical protein
MMIGVTTQENHAAGHHLFRIRVGHFETEHLRVEGGGYFQVVYLENHMAQLADLETHSLGRKHTLELSDVYGHGGSSFSRSECLFL